MDSLDAQIKALQRKKAKIALMRKVQELINAVEEPSDHEGLKDEIRAFFDGIINGAVMSIQSGNGNLVQSGPTRDPSPDRGSLPPDQSGNSEPAPRPRTFKPVPGLADFVRENARFGFKKVSAKDLNGQDVKGTVKKIDYPHLLVETTSGDLVEVDPQTAILEE